MLRKLARPSFTAVVSFSLFVAAGCVAPASPTDNANGGTTVTSDGNGNGDADGGVAPVADLATRPAPARSDAGVAPDLSTAPDLATGGASPTPDLAMPGAAPTPDLAPPVPPGLPAARAHAHHRCGWLYTNEPAAIASFNANTAFFDVIHPVWYALQPDGVSVRALAGVDDAAFLATARAAGVSVVPLVASVDDASYTRTMLYDPAKQAAHIQTLVALIQAHAYDGLELDYEHLWDAADAAPLAAFTTAFGAAMHALGKSATMAVPALDGPSSIWSYDTIAAALDYAHIMAYDYHTIGSSHAGPTAPLGWVDGIGAYVASLGHAKQFLMGLPNYGVTTASMCDLGSCAARCTGPVSSGSAEMQSCPFNWNGYVAGRVNTCQTAEGAQYFDDVASLVEKTASAKAHGLSGVAYWRLGGEPAGFFDGIRGAM